MNTIFLILAAILSLSASSARAFTAVEEDTLVAELKQQLQHRIRTFERPIKVYHYGTRGNLPKESYGKKLVFNVDEAIDLKRDGSYDSPVELNPLESESYFKDLSQSFSSAEKIKWMVGPGLYAAVDPGQSQTYAGKPWFLLQIEVPAQAKYLDLRPWNGLVVSKAFAQKWIAPNLSLSELTDTSRMGADKFLVTFKKLLTLPELRKLLVRAMDEMGAEVIAYSWIPSAIGICNERLLGDGIAFSFVNEKILSHGAKLQTLTQDMGASPSENKKQVYLEVLEKLEASAVRLSQYYTDAPLAGSKEIKRTLIEPSIDSWLMGAKIHLLTLAWNRILNRESTFNTFVIADVTIADRAITQYAKRSIISDEKTERPVFFRENFAVEEDADYDSLSLYLDPMKLLKIKDRAAYEHKLKLIENDTFGCSENSRFDGERVTPEL